MSSDLSDNYDTHLDTVCAPVFIFGIFASLHAVRPIHSPTADPTCYAARF